MYLSPFLALQADSAAPPTPYSTQSARSHPGASPTQAQLLQAGKLAAIGQLASGVAHEINNPLAAVLAFADLLDEDVAEAAAAEALSAETAKAWRNRLDKIRTGGLRCKRIVAGLLDFSRRGQSEHTQVELHSVVDATLELISAALRATGIQFIADVPTDLVVYGNASQLQQVLTNLVINAVQAIGSTGGTVRMDARARDDGFAVLEVSDNGPGIPDDVQACIFDPFCTTKEPGQGTGLGLAIVHGLVDDHGGEVSVASTLGDGTVFTVTLPLAPRVGRDEDSA